MATPAQIRANRANALLSTGPKTAEGKQASSKNRTKHGLCCYHAGLLHTTALEDQAEYQALIARLYEEHRPTTQTEKILVRRMADSEWMRVRATRLQANCIFDYQHVISTEQFALYMRYQVMHERALYKALEELRKLRAERRKEQIGSESQKPSADPISVTREEAIGTPTVREGPFEPKNPLKNPTPKYKNPAPKVQKVPPNSDISYPELGEIAD